MTDQNNRKNHASDWATVSELCETYNVSRATIHRWLKDSENVRYYLKANTMRVHRDDFAAMVDGFIQETVSRNEGKDGVRH